MKVTKNLHTKLEDLFKAMGYQVRYEKGSFRSGHCLLEDQDVIVINKFFPMESKVNALVEILRSIEPRQELLDEAQLKLVRKLQQTELKF